MNEISRGRHGLVFQRFIRHRCVDTDDPNGSVGKTVQNRTYSRAMPFSANSFLAFLFLAKCIRPMPRSTLGALVNWILS